MVHLVERVINSAWSRWTAPTCLVGTSQHDELPLLYTLELPAEDTVNVKMASDVWSPRSLLMTISTGRALPWHGTNNKIKVRGDLGEVMLGYWEQLG